MIKTLYHTARIPAASSKKAPSKGAWIYVADPTDAEVRSLVKNYDVDADLINDARDIYEAPRIEHEGSNLYFFTRYCYPKGREIATEPLLIIITKNDVLTVLRQKSDILDTLTESDAMVTTQKTKLLLQILTLVNQSYRKELMRVSREVLKIRAQIKKTEIDNEVFIGFIDLEEDLNEYLSALLPQRSILLNLQQGKTLTFYEQDQDLVDDLTLSNTELIELASSRLRTITTTREAYSTIMANNLNRTFKRLTSIAIFMTIPTIIGGLYGMNVALPLEDSRWAFFIVLGAIGLILALFLAIFHKRKWL